MASVMLRRVSVSAAARSLSSNSVRRLGSAASAATGADDTKAAAGHTLYTPAHLALQDGLRKFIDVEVNPFVDQWEAEGIFPAHDLFRKLGKAGYLGVTKPVEYGGLGLDHSYSVAFGEELGSIKAGAIPMAIGVQTDMATPALARFGSDFVKSTFLAPSIAGEVVACLGVSEPGAGSDVASLKTVAESDGDDYLISGTKMWTTNGTQADWMCALVNTGGKSIHRNKSLICIPMNLPGISTAPRFKKLGMRSSDTTQVFFDRVRVPKTHRIGEEGQGFTYQMLQFQEERLYAAASVIRPLERCIADTEAYARERTIFGKRLLDNQVVHFRLAELETELEALKSLLYRASKLYVEGNDVTKLASMAKLKAGRLSREVTDACLQYWGGMGFIDDSIVARYYRDLRLISIGAGADEVMLSILCKLRGTLPKSQ